MTESILFRIIFLALLLIFVAHRAYYIRKFPAQEKDTVIKMTAGPLTILASLLSVAALLASIIFLTAPSLISWASAAFPTWLRWLGLFISMSGFILLEWSQRALSDNWSDQPRLVREQKLVQTGPYKWIRHPIYAAFLLILGSLLLISANWLVGVAWLSSVTLEAMSRIRFEESIMQAQFDKNYESYRQRTGKLIPKFGLHTE